MKKYETFGRRVIASMLDALIVVPTGWGASVIISFAFGPVVLLYALPGIVSAFYYILMHRHGGQTLGKMAAKVAVRDDSETPLDLGQAILRSLPQLIFPMFVVSFSTADRAAADDSIAFWGNIINVFTIIFFFADVLVCLASNQKRALHDFIAGTIVVRTDV